MIQRRQFLGTTAAAAFGLAVQPAFSFGKGTSVVPGKLDWESREVTTVRDAKATRRPVVTGVSLQQEGSLIAIVGDDHLISLYDFKTGLFSRHLRKHTDWVRAAVFSPDSNKLFTCANDRKLFRWDIEGPAIKPTELAAERDAIINLAVSHDSTKVATVSHNRFAHVYDTQGIRIHRLTCSCDDNHAVAFSPDDSMLAIGGRCGTIRVFDLQTGKVQHEIAAHRRRIRSLEFIADKQLVSAGDDQIVRINQLDNIPASWQLPRMSSKLYAVQSIAPFTIATSGSDNLVHIWDIQNRSEIGVLEGHTGTVTCMDLAQQVFVTGSYDATFRIWTPKVDEVAATVTGKKPRVSNNSKPIGWQQRR